MKKHLITATFAVAIAAMAGYNTYLSHVEDGMSDMVLENVEALADGGVSEVKYLDCTRAIEWGNCYDKYTGMWVCLYISSVEDYRVIDSPIVVCSHDKVGECPSGTVSR